MGRTKGERRVAGELRGKEMVSAAASTVVAPLTSPLTEGEQSAIAANIRSAFATSGGVLPTDEGPMQSPQNYAVFRAA